MVYQKKEKFRCVLLLPIISVPFKKQKTAPRACCPYFQTRFFNPVYFSSTVFTHVYTHTSKR